MLQALLKAPISVKASDFNKKMKRRTNEDMNVCASQLWHGRQQNWLAPQT